MPSTEEVRSKHPLTSPQPRVERKAPALGDCRREVGKEKAGVDMGRGQDQRHLAEKGVSCLGHNKTQGAQTGGGEEKLLQSS